MSDGEAVQTVSRTSVHEDIIREAEETDWTVDPNEQGRDKENGEDDIEFDPDELECVDEDADDERREKNRTRDYRKHCEKQKRDEKRHRQLDSRHGVERRHPYFRHERDDRRHSKAPHCISRHRIDLSRLRKPYDPRCRRVESYAHQSPPRSLYSDALQKIERTEPDDKDIPFDELEEVDCYDEVGGDGCEFTDTASGTGESHAGEDDDFNDVCMSRSRGADCASIVGDEDYFPDLCEEIDADAMRRAAAAATDNIVLSQMSPTDRSSLPPSSTAEFAVKSSEMVSSIRDHHRYKSMTAPPSQHVQDNRSGDRREDEARRRHHSTERRECRTRRDDRRQEKKRERTDRGSHDIFSISRASNCKLPKAADMCRRDDTELISIKGPLAHGWCSADDEQKPSTSLVLPQPTKVRDYENKNVTFTRRNLLCLGTERNQAKNSEEHTAYLSSVLVAQREHNEPNSISGASKAKYGVSLQASPRKKDFGVCSSCKEHSSSSRRKMPDDHHQYHHQTNGTTANQGGSGKIPSLLDMYIKEPKELQHGSGFCSSAQLDGVNAQLHKRNVDLEKDAQKSRSLLDLDIPPPDRKMMRQYAIVLNKLELTRRPSYVRTDKRSGEIPVKIPRLSSPRSADRHERARQPRSYIHGIRKVSQ